MRELNVMEVNAVSGAGLADAVYGAVLGGVSGVIAGAIIGGIQGGEQGGILGFGLAGQLVGMFSGMIIGGAGATVAGFVLGLNDPNIVTSICSQFYNSIANGTFIGNQV